MGIRFFLGVLICVYGFLAVAQTPSIEVKEPGLSNESDLALVDAKGNSVAQSLSFKQQNGVKWDENILKAQYRYLRTQADGVESARNWDAALRYERVLSSAWSAYAAQGVESDPFAGIIDRYNSDLGARYNIIHTDVWTWLGEAGYRYTKEVREASATLDSSFARLYTEAVYNLSKSSAGKTWLEYLPNFSHPGDYFINGEVSAEGMLNSVLSLKAGYLLKYSNSPPPGVPQRLDRLLTTAFVAKF